MPRKKIVAGNWKMNMTAAEAKRFVEEFKPKVAGLNNVEVVLCPTFTSLSIVVDAVRGSAIKVGAQNVHWEASGAFTGEISAAMLKEVGVDYVIVGHSERRQYFAETDETVNKRLKAALASGLSVMVCVGEVLEERESFKTEAVIERQVKGAFAGICSCDIAKVVVAYEPVWAIGTGKTATPAMAQETHGQIRKLLAGLYGAAIADSVRIQYGGSMKPENSAELFCQPDIDGGLVGGASLKADGFAKIAASAA